jgi:uncharacterized protein YjiK
MYDYFRLLVLAIAFTITPFFTQAKPKPKKLVLLSKADLTIKEPSDICILPNANKYAIVSDNGLLFLTDTNGVVLKEADFKGFDFEGVFADESKIYVSDERSRVIYVFNYNLEKITSYQLTYYGGRNSGFESITFNKNKNCFVLITEKHPCIIFEYDTSFKELKQYSYTLSTDVSSITIHNGHLYVLCDEEKKILMLNPNDYTLESEIKLSDINPEGIAITADGRILIVSDDGQYLKKYSSDIK